MVWRAGATRTRWFGIGTMALLLFVCTSGIAWLLAGGIPRGYDASKTYCDSPDMMAPCAPGPLADAPPTLDPINGTPNGPSVLLSVSPTGDTNLAHIGYVYSQPAGEPEVGSIVRLYAMRPAGEYCLLDER